MCEQKPFPVGDPDPEIEGGGGGGVSKTFSSCPSGLSLVYGSATAIQYGFRADEKAIRYSVNIT